MKLNHIINLYYGGFNIIDIAHSVRRAQAINSEIKKWGLKYITTYIEKRKNQIVYMLMEHLYLKYILMMNNIT